MTIIKFNTVFFTHIYIYIIILNSYTSIMYNENVGNYLKEIKNLSFDEHNFIFCKLYIFDNH